ncbi:hypothetical protein ACLD02_05200 [Alloalcanivorax sp. C16-2]|uniref:hypothetical protein n=1 Tax=Alloalcanivorax TaxID=3020832 RepID=UPI0019345F3D|nr:hypothetical protein [Alloalcanivorax marinus]MBL7250314.1 hypothetical protein [Alloalcanivorax marinus]
MKGAPRATRGLGGIFALPLLIALASLIGLVAALLGDGAMDWISWLGLGLPVAAVIWAMRTRRR